MLLTKNVENNLICTEPGPINLAVNCAGVGIPEKIIGKEKCSFYSTFEKTINVNLTGTFNLIKHVANKMKDNISSEDGFRGLIVNTASIAAFDGQIGQAAYSASKGAIVSMTLPIARELSKVWDKGIQ